MKKSKRLLCALMSAIMVASIAVIPASATDNSKATRLKGEYVEGEAVVVLKDSAPADYSAKSKAASVYGSGVSLKDSIEIDADGGDSVKMAFVKSKKMTTEDLIANLKKKSGVKYAFPNYIKKISAITNDLYSKHQWALENNAHQGGTAGADIKANTLWDKAASVEKEAIVAVIDTGIDLEHEDLKDVIWTNPYGSKLVGKNGIDYTSTSSNGQPKDDNGHGTHVAGIIAAVGDNEKGISGVNKTNVKILPIKAFDSSGSGSTYSEFSGYDYIARAVKLGANIKAINCSFGGVGDEDEKKTYEELYNELGASGILIATASGNEYQNLDSKDSDYYDEEDWILPATNESPYSITVAATDEYDDITVFSNYSAKYVDVAAPGNDILSSVSYNSFNPTIYNDTQKANLVKDFQDYNGEVTAGDFGYPTVSDKKAKDRELSDKAVVSFSDTHFGTEGKSVAVTFNDGRLKDDSEGPAFLIEIPFTIEDEDAPYRISYMGSAAANYLSGYVIDVPADYDNYFDDDSYTDEFDIYASTKTWDHYECNINPSKTENYKKSKNRKLQFYIFPKKGEVFYIDDLAISKQGAEEADFGKYDYKSGTSMATPYVAGAIALVNNCCPDAKPIDVKNMVCRTGRVKEELKSKIKNGCILSLDNTEKVPPVITSVKYTSNGKSVEISGSMNDAQTVTVNGEAVTPTSISADKIVIPDNNYNTKKLKVEVSNAYGTSTEDTFLSIKPQFPVSKKVIGAPNATYQIIPVPAGDKAYFVDSVTGFVDELSYKISSDKYVYKTVGMMNFNELSKEKQTDASSFFVATSAVYNSGKIYFTAVRTILSSYLNVIGYDTAFASYDIAKGKITLICEIPNVPVDGATLVSYKDKFYIIGGYNAVEHTYLDNVYKYNPGANAFEEVTTNLPEGRAYTNFVVYGGKLVGVYGSTASGEMPPAIVFDGTKWTTSAVVFDSEDKSLIEKTPDGKSNYVYEGNVGIGENGVFCNGAYVYGVGDTFTYKPSNDTVTPSKYSMTNSLSDGKIFGTTIPGCFIGFTADKYIEDDDDDNDPDYAFSRIKFAGSSSMFNFDDDDDDYVSKTAYLLPLKNTKSDPSKQTYIKLKKSSASLYVKGTCKINATIRNPKGKTTYTSSNKKIAKVSSKGVVTALKKGKAKITVKNNGVKQIFTVTVKNPALKPDKMTLKTGKSSKIKIIGKVGKAKFVSSDSEVAAVNLKGKVTGKSKGKAAITVTINGVKLKCDVTVK
ncbi:MAG: S8 family serine peptidase [Ruminococcus sp.]|nr:S8 family serine peptidase [Ruminococcus sp.]